MVDKFQKSPEIVVFAGANDSVIYDNSAGRPFWIFKKRKEKMYFDECTGWKFQNIRFLTDVSDMEKKDLNLTRIL